MIDLHSTVCFPMMLSVLPDLLVHCFEYFVPKMKDTMVKEQGWVFARIGWYYCCTGYFRFDGGVNCWCLRHSTFL